jgi:hypothetical protein
MEETGSSLHTAGRQAERRLVARKGRSGSGAEEAIAEEGQAMLQRKKRRKSV